MWRACSKTVIYQDKYSEYCADNKIIKLPKVLELQDKNVKEQSIDLIKDELEYLDELLEENVEDICCTIRAIYKNKP